jgi:membrane associated rhomboid family serine protease
MFRSIWTEVRQQFVSGNMVMRLILLNVTVWVLLNVVFILSTPFVLEPRDWINISVIKYLAVSRSLAFDAWHPWVLVTSMFVHFDFYHLLWNMLPLYWFGRIVADLVNDRRLLSLYILGGLAGIVTYLLGVQFGFIVDSPAYGASAAMMSVCLAAGFLAPDFLIYVWLIGEIKLKYIIALFVFLDLIAIASRMNVGGQIAHLGGAAFGTFFVLQLQKGIDLGRPLQNMLAWVEGFFTQNSSNHRRRQNTFQSFKRKKTTHTSNNRPTTKAPRTDDDQVQLDIILEKIKEKGYGSLSAAEKETLFNASKK